MQIEKKMLLHLLYYVKTLWYCFISHSNNYFLESSANKIYMCTYAHVYAFSHIILIVYFDSSRSGYV